MDCVVLKILIPVCTVLRREREQEIKRLAEHNEDVYKRQLWPSGQKRLLLRGQKEQ